MIILKKIRIGDSLIEIPVSFLKGSKQGKKILITAGVDGDELAGIKAAYQLINYYQSHEFSGELTIIPIVNIPGFYSYTSFNPLDKKFPKYIYPGSVNGFPSEQLIFWLNENFIKSSDVWIDLHGGASSEILNPFVSAYKTSNKYLNDLSEKIISSIDSEIKVYETVDSFSKEEKISKNNCLYLLLESGELGTQKLKDIRRHVKWVQQTVQILNSVTKKLVFDITYYNKCAYIIEAQEQGLWTPLFKDMNISKGEILGIFTSLDKKKNQRIISHEDGVILWAKSILPVQKGDELVAMVFNKDLKNVKI